VAYHVGLDLTESQIKELKQVALSCDKSVKALVTGLVIEAIEIEKEESKN